MLRLIVRVLGLWLIAGALVAAVIDGAKSIARSRIETTPLGQFWFDLSPTSLGQAQAAIERHVGAPWLWDLIASLILATPAWGVLAVVGSLLMLIGRRKRPRRDFADQRLA